jgi:hypothetical protein
MKEQQLNADYLCRAFEMLDYDAIGLGEMDFAFGAGYLRAKQKEHGLPFVTTNAVDSRTGEPVFAPYVVRERDGFRVGFLSVISPERHIIAQAESALLDSDVRLDDPTEAVLKWLPRIRAECDLVVLLSHSGIETSKFLAEDLEVDVVVVGHYPSIQNDPEKVGNAVIAMAGVKADRYGTLDLTVAGDGSITAFDGDAIRLLKDGPANGDLVALEGEWDKAVQDQRREFQLEAQRERDAALAGKLTDDIHTRGGVFGAESCKSCHQGVYDSWMQTPHATAFARLAEADAWDNPECVGCHVTGISDKHYVVDVNVSPETWNVQCEECHGLAVHHARDGSYVTQGEATCRKCHDPENSPEFDYAVYSEYGVH